jgi:ATP-dependent Zn protease
MPRNPTRLRHIAYHEAGHAVIDYVVGFVCVGVTIVPEKGVLGCASYRVGWEQCGKLRDESSVVCGQIMSCMAGYLSEIAAFEEVLDIGWDRGDQEHIIMLVEGLGIGERKLQRYLDRLQLRALALVCRHWRKIEIVAETLLTHRTLTGDEFNALIDSVTSAAERSRARRIAAARKPTRDAWVLKQLGPLWSESRT